MSALLRAALTGDVRSCLVQALTPPAPTSGFLTCIVCGKADARVTVGNVCQGVCGQADPVHSGCMLDEYIRLSRRSCLTPLAK